MGELRESSMLISLRALMETERERVVEEQEARLRAEVEAERREQEALLERKRAEERQRVEAERRTRDEERRRREEEARLLAIQRAEIERVRLEAEHRAALEVLERKQRHERELASSRAAKRSDASRYFLWFALALGACVAVPIGVYFLAIAPGDDELRESYMAQIANERARAEEAARLAREAQLERERAERALQDRERERQKRDVAPPPAADRSARPKENVRLPPRQPPTRVKQCNPEDPMDFCL